MFVCGRDEVFGVVDEVVAGVVVTSRVQRQTTIRWGHYRGGRVLEIWRRKMVNLEEIWGMNEWKMLGGRTLELSVSLEML